MGALRMTFNNIPWVPFYLAHHSALRLNSMELSETDVGAQAGPALEVLEHDASGKSLAKRVLRKIDWRLMPLMFVTYNLNFMDKTILSSASVFGLREDTVSHTITGCLEYANARAAPRRTGVFLGQFGFLFWVLLLGIPHDSAHHSITGRKVHGGKHRFLGHCGCSYGGVYQLRRPDHGPLLPRRRRGHYHPGLYVYNFYLVHQ